MATKRESRLNGDRVTMRDFYDFQNEVDRIVTDDINRYEDRLERVLNRLDDRLKADREASEARLKADREEFNRRFEEERKEWRSYKRWLYLNFGGVVTILIAIATAVIGYFVRNGI